MTDDMNPSTPTPEPPSVPQSPRDPSPSEAWNDVVARMTELGDAIVGWARAATDDPDNRRHLEQVRQSLNDMSAKAAETFSEVAQSDFGKSVSASATQAGQAFGDAAQSVGEAAAPHLATAFAGLADVFGKAAVKVSESTPRSASEPSAPEPPVTPAPPAPEPPAAPMTEPPPEGDSEQ